MKRKLKTVLLVVLCIALAAGGGCGWYALQKARYETHTFPLPENVNELETEPYVIDYVFDPNDLKQMSAVVSDIIVGRVEACVGTTYDDVSFRNGKWTATPATHYRITPQSNLKGSLQTGVPLEAEVFGGVQIGGKRVMEPSGGFLSVGHWYLLFMNTDPDGGLHINKQIDCGETFEEGELAPFLPSIEAGLAAQQADGT